MRFPASTIWAELAEGMIDEAQLPKPSQAYDTGERSLTAIEIGK